jgi:putative SOS response-associated peptidase YedK
VNDPQKAKSILDESFETEQRELWLCMSLPDDRKIAQLINKLQENHLEIYEVRKQKKDLESMFLELMQTPQ